MPIDIPEDQLAFPTRVAGVYHAGNVLAPKQLHEEFEAFLTALDRLQIEVRWNHGQVGERPLASFDLHALGWNELQKMADRRRKDVVPAFVVVAVARKAAQSARDVIRHGGLFGDDEFLGHWEEKIAKTDDRIRGRLYAKRRMISVIGT